MRNKGMVLTNISEFCLSHHFWGLWVISSVLSSALVAWSSWSNWFSSIYYPFLETQANPQSSFWGSAGCDFSPVPSCQFGNCWRCTHCLLLASSLLTSRLWLLWWSVHDCLSCFVWIKATANRNLGSQKKKWKKLWKLVGISQVLWKLSKYLPPNSKIPSC